MISSVLFMYDFFNCSELKVEDKWFYFEDFDEMESDIITSFRF